MTKRVARKLQIRQCVWLAVACAAVVSPSLAAQEPLPRATISITKHECRKVDSESSIRVVARDQDGKPAEGLWIDATTKEYGREQSVQNDDNGVGKLWVGRDRTYVIHAYGYPFQADVRLRGVRVALGCELQVRVAVYRPDRPPDIIY